MCYQFFMKGAKMNETLTDLDFGVTISPEKNKVEGGVLYLDNLPAESPDAILGFAVYELDFGDEAPRYALIPPNLANFMNV